MSVRQPGRVWIGTSGYAYPGWRGAFYPSGLPVTAQLPYAAAQFSSIEINRSFYALLSPAAFRTWYASVPKDFVFALKGSRFITHMKKLREPEGALANFFASGPLALEEKLGPIVWQLPERMPFEPARLEAFLCALPRSTRAAAKLGRLHDARVKHGTYLDVQNDRPIRYALEPRHPTFLCAQAADLLRAHDVALVISDSPRWEYAEEPTSGFMYLRLHGSRALYRSAYDELEIAAWADRIDHFRRGLLRPDARRLSTARHATRPMDVYVYFDNDAEAFAPRDATRLGAAVAALEHAGEKPPGREQSLEPNPRAKRA